MDSLLVILAIGAAAWYISNAASTSAAASSPGVLPGNTLPSPAGSVVEQTQGPTSTASNGSNTGATPAPSYSDPNTLTTIPFIQPVTLPVPVSTLPGSTVIDVGPNYPSMSVDDLVSEFNKYAVPGPNNLGNVPSIASYSVNTDGTINFSYTNGKSFSNFDPTSFYALVSSFVSQQANM